MKERPIIFSGPMVRAILDGRKTQTRRPVDMTNPHRPISFLGGEGEEDDPEQWGYFFDGPDHNGYMVLARGLDERRNHGSISIRCPYGDVGDRLWVRETWCLAHPDYHTEQEGEKLGRTIQDGRWCHYAATDDVDDNDGKSPWRPPLFMPRWASRILLEIAEVRIQRLQDISEEDARAEGVKRDDAPCDHKRASCEEIGCLGPTHRSTFCELWDSLNAKRAPWVENPWVWAITFKRVETRETTP